MHDWYHWTIDDSDLDFSNAKPLRDEELTAERRDLASVSPSKSRAQLFEGLGPYDTITGLGDLGNGMRVGYFWSSIINGDRDRQYRYDTDRDTIDNHIENAASNHGDGDFDGTLDSLQDTVVSLPNSVNKNYLTLKSLAGMKLLDVKAVVDPSGGNLPQGIEFPVGFIQFRIDGLSHGGTTSLELSSFGRPFDLFYKYGPTPDNAIPHWYDFTYDGSTGAKRLLPYQCSAGLFCRIRRKHHNCIMLRLKNAPN